MTDEHMMNSADVHAFADAMLIELEKHKAEKTGLKNSNPDFVWNLVLAEIETRLEVLKDSNPDEMEKQCVHMANYLFFLWMKMKEINLQ